MCQPACTSHKPRISLVTKSIPIYWSSLYCADYIFDFSFALPCLWLSVVAVLVHVFFYIFPGRIKINR